MSIRIRAILTYDGTFEKSTFGPNSIRRKMAFSILESGLRGSKLGSSRCKGPFLDRDRGFRVARICALSSSITCITSGIDRRLCIYTVLCHVPVCSLTRGVGVDLVGGMYGIPASLGIGPSVLKPRHGELAAANTSHH